MLDMTSMLTINLGTRYLHITWMKQLLQCYMLFTLSIEQPLALASIAYRRDSEHNHFLPSDSWPL
jgi:hypothetical protein